jgi:3-phenylpropionate/trans-cinnamate dioxygenase ferredoxin subunit
VTVVDAEALERRGYIRTPAGPAAEVVTGAAKIIELQGIEVGLFRYDGAIFAIRNHCPHQGAPICRGRVVGTMLPSVPGEYVYGLEGRVLSCPWHHWSYDIVTGEALFDIDPSRLISYHVETYEVEQEGDEVYVWVRPRRETTTRDD